MPATAVKERPILMCGDMVRATLDDRKTMTRRIIKPQPEALGDDCWRFRDRTFISSEQLKDYLFHDVYGAENDPAMPYGGVYEGHGDRLWVRETFRETEDIDGRPVMEYRAGGTRLIVGSNGSRSIAHGEHRCTSILPKWRPSIFLPRWACRLIVELTDVGVERVQEITAVDILSEGVQLPVTRDGRPLIRLTGKCPPCDYHRPINIPKGETLSDDELWRCHFASLWDTVNGEGAWQRNDWVWVLSFRRMEVANA